MRKEDAIEYLKEKGKLEDKKKYNKKEQEEINKVVKEGKIYGDPIAEIQW